MISFLQGFLQKHHKWIFSLLLFVIIVSFVFTIGNSPGIGTGRRAKREKFFGYDLHSERERNALFRETQVSTVLNGTFIFFEAQLVQLALQRALELHHARELHIPEPDEEQLREKIRQMPKFFAKGTQDFDAASYEKTIQELLQDPQMTPAIIQKVLSDDWKIECVRGALGRQGYAFPSQARDRLERAEAQYSFDVLLLAEEDKDERVLPEEELRAYVQRHSERYSDPESYRLACIEFDPERHRAQIPAVTKESLKKFYLEHKEDFQSLEEGSDELKRAIGEAYEKAQTRSMASQKASDFAYQLYEKELRPDAEAFDALLTAFELRLEELPLFVPGRPREDKRFSPDELSALVATLDEERPFSDPIETKDEAIVLLVLQETLPPRPSEFENVRERALEELRQERRREAFQARCKEISAKLAQLKSEAGADEASEARVRALRLESKSFAQLKPKELQAQVSPPVRQALETLPEGQVSPELLQDKRCEWVWLHSKGIDAAAIGEEQVQKILASLEQRMAQHLEHADFTDALERFTKQPASKK
ncbi:MAG: SurA N-terminal domain-containing protein [Puniceicoccales bacterium]|jgi:peptidyl-prolyl cis-trans isomerase D|nr:SurA N-terminal domain-containing protein [Puniceicoccales bacterium]